MDEHSALLSDLGLRGMNSDSAGSTLGAQEMRPIEITRHGATSMNNNDVSVDRIRGWKDVELSPEGREEATRLGVNMRGSDITHLVSSDLARAHETAKRISQLTNIPLVHVSDSFRPWNVGDLTGKKSIEACPILARYVQENPDKPVPGGESFNAFKERFFTGLTSILAQPGIPGLVTHHRNERVLHAWQAKGFPEDGSLDMRTFNKKGEPTGSTMKMDIPVDRLMSVMRNMQGAQNG
jgi:broad specificity phosphatase PhoE